MARLHHTLLDVFTEAPLAGNPVAVFPHAERVPAELMQRIAAELNLSESVFVTHSDASAHRYGVRIMTPTTELPFAGHPTIGTAVALARSTAGSGPVAMERVEAIGPVPAPCP